MKNAVSKAISFVVLFSPLTALAAVIGQTGTIGGIITTIKTILDQVVYIIIGFAVVFFLYGLIKYITSGDAEDKSKARNYMIWGIVGLFVMISIWSLVAILNRTFGISAGGGPEGVPGIPGITY